MRGRATCRQCGYEDSVLLLLLDTGDKTYTCTKKECN